MMLNSLEEMYHGVAHLDMPIPKQEDKLMSSIIQAPRVELKELPKHLKYAYIGANETLPVIISSELTLMEEDRLIRMLRRYNEAIGWTLADIKGISPVVCMHKILLEENVKPV